MNYSLILLCYNQEDYIAEAVRGALAQDGPPIEILVSDDCSTDNTFARAQAVVSNYNGPHEVVLNRNERNLGVVQHIQASFERSQGDVIIAASGDDVSLPQRALRLRETFERTGAWLVHSQARCVDLAGKPLPNAFTQTRLIKTQEPLKLARSLSLYLGATAAFRKDMTRKYGPLRDPLLYEDLIYGFRAALERKVAYVPEELVVYRMGTGISSGTPQPGTVGYAAWRDKYLQRASAVYGQRLQDARRFGLRWYDPCVRRLITARATADLERAKTKREWWTYAQRAAVCPWALWGKPIK